MKNEYKRTMRQLTSAKRRHGAEKTLWEGLKDLRKVVNKHFANDAFDWTPKDVFIVMGYGADIRDADFLETLKNWEAEGYIKIIDTPKCLFRALKPFPEEDRKKRE